MEPLIVGQPEADVLVLVRRVVVQNDMHRQAFRDLLVDLGEELDELLVPVPRHAGSGDMAGQDIQCGKQGRGAVPLVVVGHRPGPALDHRQRRLRAVQGLHRGLLVHAQHDRVLRRVQVQPDDIDQFLLEFRIVRHLERLHQMRFQPPRRPDPLDRRLRHPDLRRHRPTGPMSLPVGLGTLCQLDDLLDLGLRDDRLPAPPLPHLPKLGQPLRGESDPPRRHRRRTHS